MQPTLLRELAALRLRLRLCWAARGFALAIGICGLAYVAFRLTAGRLAPPGDVIAPALLLSLMLVTLGRLVVWPLARPLDLQYIALLLERHFPQLQDALATAAQFAEGRTPLSAASPALAGRVVEQASAALAALPQREALPLRALLRAHLATAMGLAALVVGLLVPPVASARMQPPPPPAAQEAYQEPTPPPAQPAIYDVAMRFQPPTYTALPAETRTSGYEDVLLLAGTSVTVTARCDNASSAEVRVGGKAIPSGSSPAEVNATFTVTRDTNWELVARSGSGEAAQVGPFRIAVGRDSPPSVQIIRPGKDLALEAIAPIEIGITAADDYAVSRLALQYRRLGAHEWQLTPVEGAGKAVSAAMRWDLAPMNLQPGQGVEYRAIAWDNDTMSGPKAGMTQIFRVTYGGVAGLPPQKAVEQAQKAEEEALTKLETEAQDIDKTLGEMLKRAESGRMSAQDTARAQADLKAAQERLQRLADKMREAMARVEQTMKLSDLITPQMQEKIAELHRLMQDVLDKDMKALLDKVTEALQKTAPEKLQASLEEARKMQERFTQKLEQTLALLKRAKAEAELSALRTEVEKLAAQQKAERERTRGTADFDKPTTRQEAQKQSDLARDTARLPDKVGDLAAKMQEASPEAAGRLDRLNNDLTQRDPAGKMRQATKALQDGRASDALQPQQEAETALEEAAAQLAGAEADMNGQMRRELTDAARRMTRDALYLSQEQGRLRQQSAPLAAQSLQQALQNRKRAERISRDQQAVQEGLDNLTQRMRDLAGKTPLMDPELAQQGARISQDMEQAQRFLEGGQAGPAQAQQESAVGGLNDLAQRLIALGDKFSKASAQQELSEYMKRLEAMAKQQQSVNDRTQQQQQGEGMPGSGQRPQQGTGQLALEQALLRQALQRMMQGAGKEGTEGGRLQSQLGNVPGQMKEVEGDLEGARVTPRTIQKQRDILRKMMDAQHSLYNKEQESKERVAEKPKAWTPPQSPPRLLPSQLTPPPVKGERKELVEERLPLDYEGLVKAYLGEIRR